MMTAPLDGARVAGNGRRVAVVSGGWRSWIGVVVTTYVFIKQDLAPMFTAAIVSAFLSPPPATTTAAATALGSAVATVRCLSPASPRFAFTAHAVGSPAPTHSLVQVRAVCCWRLSRVVAAVKCVESVATYG